MATSCIGAFSAVESDLVYASASALICFEVAAECAVKLSRGPGTFKEKIFDCIFNLDKKTVDRMQKVAC
jgi:hydroxyethylthiazole kinase